jgi:putative oxidoreductase
MPDNYQNLLMMIGRVLLGGFFAVAGIHHFFTIPNTSQAMAQRGVPAATFVLLAGTAFQIAAGALLLAGIRVQAAALGLVIFTLAASIMLVDFWNREGAARESALTTWKSNLAIIGGLLIAAAQ